MSAIKLIKIGLFVKFTMKFYLIKLLAKFFIILSIFSNIYAIDGDFDSGNVDLLDKVLETEFSPCSDVQNLNSTKSDANHSSLVLSGDSLFISGEIFTGAGNAKAIVDSYDLETNVLNYYQTADTGFSSFSIDEVISGSTSGGGIIIDIPVKANIPCFERVVSIDQGVREMVYIFEESLMDVLSSLQTKLDNERVSASNSLAAIQERLIQEEIAAFEAKLEAELAAQQMMAEIIAEEALAKRLAEFQEKLEAEKAAAAASTAAYQARVAEEAFEAEYKAQQAKLMEQLALEKEIAAFEAKLEAELAAQQMMAEIIAEEALAKRLAEFQEKLEAEKAAAAASTAAYQSKLAYDAKVNKIMEDLTREITLAKELTDFEVQLAEELIAQATAKLEDEKVVGAISGEIVTVLGHESCKDTLNLSDHNVDLFRLSLAGNYLYNVGPLSQFGTEFSANRWDKYISCIGSYNE